ncbi:MAG: zinc-binding dehydrogenase [Janthinobacterium lividum]
MSQMTRSAVYEVADAGIAFKRHVLPELGSQDLLVKVSAAALNRADVLQRYGKYAPPPGETDVPGIEIAGEVVAVGSDVNSHEDALRDGVDGDVSGNRTGRAAAYAGEYRCGDKVCGVVSGGGFSEYCILDSKMAMPIPQTWTFEEAAAWPEAALTADEALNGLGGVSAGQVVLVHAASSGIGTMLVKMGCELGAVMVATTSTPSKVAALSTLGAQHVIAGAGRDFAPCVRNATGVAPMDVDVVVDFMGGAYLNGNIDVLKRGGRLVLAGVMDGHISEVDLVPLINKRIQLLPLTLRMKPLAEKRAVNARFLRRWVETSKFHALKPVVHAIFPFEQLAQAQMLMESNKHFGKIVVSMTNVFS